MNNRPDSVSRGWIAGLCLLTALAATAQTLAAVKPAPPPQICVNSQCVNTPKAAAAAGAGSIKWNPGHYMGSNTVLNSSSTIGTIQAEMDDINNQDAIQGYRIFITWGALEKSQGVYDFSVTDAILARLKTAYNKPKRLVIYVWLYAQGAMNTNDGRVVPLYVQNDAGYGASPVPGSYGWWGKNANGNSTGMYAPALYYAPVMDRLIALVQALGNHYDAEPNVEAVVFQEDATIAQAASGLGSTDPHYSDAAWLAQLERLLTASTAAFPHTSIVMDNSWFDRPPSGVALQQWMVTNRIAPGSADVWGQSGITTYGTSHLSDGMQTLMGVDQNGGLTDLRPQTRAMVEVEGPDLFGPYFGSYGGPWSVPDIVDALNQSYQASHAFWTHLNGTEIFRGAAVVPGAKWSNLATTLATHPLTHTDYPPNYP